MKSFSIKRRLLTYLLIGFPILWLAIISTINYKLWHELNELNDSQMVQLSGYLSAIEPPNAPTILPTDMGELENDYLGFAIWDKNGRLLLADDNGKDFDFVATPKGFLDKGANPFRDDWRVFYVQSFDHKRIIGVGQNLESRQEIVTQALIAQTVPMLVGLVLFIALVVWAVQAGFAPLRQISQTIQGRDVADDTPLSFDVPSEIAPLVASLNRLFAKVADTLAREKRFTADASHELRSPLTALQLQNDVLKQQLLGLHLNQAQETALFEQVQKMSDSVQRANHLVEQLLILAKLDPQLPSQNEQTPIDWLDLSDRALSQVNRFACEKNSQLKRICDDVPILPITGNWVLLELLLRNLLDNAIRYAPMGATITLMLLNDCIIVQNTGDGVREADLARLSERFFRPSVNQGYGSGLGLSIVKRIAELHGLTLDLQNWVENGQVAGFRVRVGKKRA